MVQWFFGGGTLFGEKIAAARKQAHLTQQQLGEALGYTGRSAAMTVQKWEHDRQPVPIYKLRQLAKVLHLTLDDLIP